MTRTFTRNIRPITHPHILRNKFQSAASCKLNRCSPHDANYSVIFQKLFRVGPPLFMRERTLSLMKTDYNSAVMETRGDFSISSSAYMALSHVTPPSLTTAPSPAAAPPVTVARTIIRRRGPGDAATLRATRRQGRGSGRREAQQITPTLLAGCDKTNI